MEAGVPDWELLQLSDYEIVREHFGISHTMIID